MTSAHVGRSNAAPFRVVPDRGQRAEYVSDPSLGIKDCCDVFQHKETRSKLANDPRELEKESRSVTLKAPSFAGQR